MPLTMKAAQALPGDPELVERMRASDPDALRMIVERYQDRIFALIYGIVPLAIIPITRRLYREQMLLLSQQRSG